MKARSHKWTAEGTGSCNEGQVLTPPYPPDQKQLHDDAREAAEENHGPEALDDMVEVRRLGVVRDEVGVGRVGDERLVRGVERPREQNEGLEVERVVREALGVVVELDAGRAPEPGGEHDADEERALGVVHRGQGGRRGHRARCGVGRGRR